MCPLNEIGTLLLPSMAQFLRKVVQPPSDLLNCSQNTHAHLKSQDNSFQKGTRCPNCDQKRRKKDISRPARCTATLLSCFVFSHHIPTPLLPQPVHGERRLPCCDKEASWQQQPHYQLHAFPGTTHPGRYGSSRTTFQVLNLPGSEKAFQLTGLAPKHTEQGFSTLCSDCCEEELPSLPAHDSTSPSQSGGNRFFHMSPKSGDRLPHDSNLPSSSIKCKAISAQPAEKKGVRMSGAKERLTVGLATRVCA